MRNFHTSAKTSVIIIFFEESVTERAFSWNNCFLFSMSLFYLGKNKSNFLKKKVWWFKLIWLSKYPLISLYHLMSLIQEKKETIDQKIHEDQGTPLTFQFKRVNNYLRIISLWLFSSCALYPSVGYFFWSFLCVSLWQWPYTKK